LGFDELIADTTNITHNIKPDASVLLSVQPTEYRLGVGDELVVSVWGRPDLGSQLPDVKDSRRNLSIINENGKISLPFIGEISMVGLTTTEAVETIRKAYQTIVDDDAKIDVTIVGYQSGQVLLEGEIKQPGTYEISNLARTLGDIILKAGGLRRTADTRNAVLVRDNKIYHLNYHAGQLGISQVHNIFMNNNDRVYFPSVEEKFVVVMGEVGLQRAIPIPVSGLRLTEALAKSGGISVVNGDYDKIFVSRFNGELRKVYQLSLNELLHENPLMLQNNDLVFVGPTALARWSRLLGQALTGVSVGTGVSSMYYNFNVDSNRYGK